MTTVNGDGTFLCDHEGCECKVADDENFYKSGGKIFCSEQCAKGKGCEHPHCGCAEG